MPTPDGAKLQQRRKEQPQPHTNQEESTKVKPPSLHSYAQKIPKNPVPVIFLFVYHQKDAQHKFAIKHQMTHQYLIFP